MKEIAEKLEGDESDLLDRWDGKPHLIAQGHSCGHTLASFQFLTNYKWTNSPPYRDFDNFMTTEIHK